MDGVSDVLAPPGAATTSVVAIATTVPDTRLAGAELARNHYPPAAGHHPARPRATCRAPTAASATTAIVRP